MKELISLIIITYNRPDDLLELLSSIQKQENRSSLKEILILNNASSISYAGVEAFVHQNPELKINYIVSDINLGVSKGRNKLMSMAAGSLLLVLDDDVVFQYAGDLRKIASVFENPFFKEAKTGIITFRVLYYETKQVQKTAFPHKHFEEYKDKAFFLTSYFTGCAHILKKDILKDTGLYPEDFFYGMEEYDLSYRVINAGYSIGYDNIVTFEHKESPTGRQPNFQKLASQWINKSKVAWRYLPFWYYVSTMIAWSFEYIRKANGHWGTYFKSWLKVSGIPYFEKRARINKKGLEYLGKVKARLWY